MSFYVKSSIAGTFSFQIYQDDGADIIGSTYTINSADTWERKTITFPGNTLATIANDNGIGLYMQWTVFAGSDYTGGDNTTWKSYATNLLAHGHSQNGHATTDESTFQLAGCQFELGDVATPFEHIDFADNLAKCQRYYYVLANGTSQPMGTGSWYGSTEIDWFAKTPVTMRATPSLEVEAGTNYYRSIGSNTYDDFNGVALASDKSVEGVYLYATNAGHGASGTQGDASIVTTNNASAKVALSAEL